MTAHLNWFSYLQEEDHDVWEYLFNNYLLPVIKKKASLKEIRYIENKRLMKLIKKFRGVYEGTAHDGRWFIRYNTLREYALKPHPIYNPYYGDMFDRPRCFGGVQFTSEVNKVSTLYSVNGRRAKIKIDGTKDQIMKHLEENQIKCRKSWTKDKMVQAMLSF